MFRNYILLFISMNALFQTLVTRRNIIFVSVTGLNLYVLPLVIEGTEDLWNRLQHPHDSDLEKWLIKCMDYLLILHFKSAD